MVKKCVCIIISFMLSVSSLTLTAQASEELDLELIKQRYFEYYYSLTDATDEDALGFLNSQSADGTWSDINYDDAQNKTVVAWEHLIRLLKITKSACTYGHTLYNSREDAVHALDIGLKAWKSRVPVVMQPNGYLTTTSNWWNDTIGQQLHWIIPIICLSYTWLPEDCMDIALEYLLNDVDMKNYPSLLTGANLAWYMNSAMVKAVFTDDVDEIKRCYEMFAKLSETSTKIYQEGIKPDNSFHQHGPDYYTSYEINLERCILINAYVFRDTAIENKKIYTRLAELILDGDRWLYTGKDQTLLVIGRNISDKPGSNDTVAMSENLMLLAELYPERRSELLEFKVNIENDNKQKAAVVGNKHFWCSDIMIHKRDGYSAATRLSSEKTRSTESNAVQNKFGSYVGFGMMLLTTPDSSQNDDKLFFDWGHLPGVTSPADVEQITKSGTFIMQNEDFVGGVSDREYGAAVMRLNKWHTTANKSYFFFDDCYVALGSGINTLSDNVSTTVDQRHISDSLKINGREYSECDGSFSDVSTVLAGSIGYYFPHKETLNISFKEISARWSDIGNSNDTTLYNRRMFKAYKVHSKTSRNDTYEYVVFPNTTQEKLDSLDSRIEVISNTKDVQAVYDKSSGVGYVVFYKSGECQITDEVKIAVDEACVIMLKNSDIDHCVYVSDPTGNCRKIKIKYTDNNGVKKKYIYPEDNVIQSVFAQF